MFVTQESNNMFNQFIYSNFTYLNRIVFLWRYLPGLTMVVGPPGTGKTDVAVQIISNIYHNFPDQRTLIVTHSNQALNQLFEKIMALDIDERHLLRLGHGKLRAANDFWTIGQSHSFTQNYAVCVQLNTIDSVRCVNCSGND